jgi:hypothetical protein
VNKLFTALSAVFLLAFPAWGQVASRDFVASESDNVDVGTAVSGYLCDGTGAADFSMCAWAKVDFTATGGSGGEIASNWDGQGFLLDARNYAAGNDYELLFCYTQGSTSGNAKSADYSIVDNEWTYVCCVQQSSDDKWDPYVNGVLDESGGTPVPVSSCADDSGNNGRIGNRPDESNDIDGEIAYVQFWTRNISAEEVNQSMHCPGSVTKDLLAYWPLTDSGTQYDQSGNGNNGTNSGTAASTDGPPVSTNCAGAIQ